MTPDLLFLEGGLTIYRAAEVKDQLLGALVLADRLQVDLAGVTEIDSAGVQLLLLARRTAETMGRALHLSAHSAPVREVFDLLALDGRFAAVPA